MSEITKIAWCDSTVNFWSGCLKVSPGCAHCYAEVQSWRFPTFGMWGPGAPRRLHESAFNLAHRLSRKPWVCDECGAACAVPASRRELHPCHCGAEFHRRRIFSLSLGDWLDPEVPVAWLARMLDTIRRCPDVIWMLLTKRPEIAMDRLRDVLDYSWRSYTLGRPFQFWMADWCERGNPPDHIAIGASVEDQQRADERIPHLLRIPARWRFVSLEPLLGPVLLPTCNGRADCPLGDAPGHSESPLGGIDWLIIGGESGPKARPCNVEWIRDLIRQGRNAGVATFVKQLGAFPIVGPCHPTGQLSYSRLNLTHPKGGDPSEWPEDLRVREQCGKADA